MPNIISERIITSPRVPRSRRVDVEITPEIIAEATKEDSSHCMIADAVRAAVPGASSISVDLQTIRFSDKTKRMRYVYLTPRMAQLALLDFDAGEKLEPFKFRLDRAHIVAMKSKNDPVLHPEKARMTPARTAAITKARASRAQTVAEEQTAAERRNQTRRDERAAASAERLKEAGPMVTDHGGNGSVPVRVGGATPPIGALASGSTGRKRQKKDGVPTSRRRQYGLRAMERGSEKTLRSGA